jgi:hypothetical protein
LGGLNSRTTDFRDGRILQDIKRLGGRVYDNKALASSKTRVNLCVQIGSC